MTQEKALSPVQWITRYFFEPIVADPGTEEAINSAFRTLVGGVMETIPPTAESTAGLRKLLEARDAFLRAAETPVRPQGSGAATACDFGGDDPADRMRSFFGYKHLKEGLMQDTSKRVHDAMERMLFLLEPSAERTAGMRKLLEAKDCLVRAAMTSSPS